MTELETKLADALQRAKNVLDATGATDEANAAREALALFDTAKVQPVQDLPPLPNRIEELLGEYWDAAYDEGTGHAPEADPNETLSQIREAVRDYARAAMGPSRAKRLSAAGFTPRDTRLDCEECGKKVSAQMLPLHKCETTSLVDTLSDVPIPSFNLNPESVHNLLERTIPNFTMEDAMDHPDYPHAPGCLAVWAYHLAAERAGVKVNKE